MVCMKTTSTAVNDNDIVCAVYIDVDPVNILDPIRLFAFVGNSETGNYKWNIKITLIDCTRNTDIQGFSFMTINFTMNIPI